MASKKKARKQKDAAKTARKAELRAKYKASADDDRAERLAGFAVQLQQEITEHKYRESHEDISFQSVVQVEQPVPMRVSLIRDPRSRRFG